MITFKDRDIAQCRANIEAGLKHYGLLVPLVAATLKDRVIFSYDPWFLSCIEASIRFSDWKFVQNHGTTARFGWRENVPFCSMQIIEHTDSIEVDYDLYNPDFGMAPAIGHFIECLWPGKTNPYRVMKGLRKRGIPVEEIG